MRKFIIITIFVCWGAFHLGFRSGGFRTNTSTAVPWHFEDSLYLGDALVCSTDVKIIDDLYVVDSTFHGGAVIDSGTSMFLETMTFSNSTADADTALYIKHYGARTTSYGIVVDIDTSENTAANVTLIDLSGSNAADGGSDYYIYISSSRYWSADGALRSFQFETNSFRNYSGSNWAFTNTLNSDVTFSHLATKKGDFIIRDGNLGVANADFFQIQDSAGTDVVAQIGNDGASVFDQTKTVGITTATADTGLVITIDSIPTGGGGDVVNHGLVINGLSWKDNTQFPLRITSRTGNDLFFVRGDGTTYCLGVFTTTAGLVNNGETTLGNAVTDTVIINGKVEVNTSINYAADAQEDDDYEVAIPGITALTAGLTVTFLANTLNTDGATLEITSVGDIDAILKNHDVALATGDIEAGQIIVVVWDGSNWQMTSQLAQ